MEGQQNYLPELKEAVTELFEEGIDAQFLFDTFCTHFETQYEEGMNIKEFLRIHQDSFLGAYCSREMYFREYWTETHDIPEEIEPYIDWERMADDAERNGEFTYYENEADDKYYVMRG